MAAVRFFDCKQQGCVCVAPTWLKPRLVWSWVGLSLLVHPGWHLSTCSVWCVGRRIDTMRQQQPQHVNRQARWWVHPVLLQRLEQQVCLSGRCWNLAASAPATNVGGSKPPHCFCRCEILPADNTDNSSGSAMQQAKPLPLVSLGAGQLLGRQQHSALQGGCAGV